MEPHKRIDPNTCSIVIRGLSLYRVINSCPLNQFILSTWDNIPIGFDNYKPIVLTLFVLHYMGIL